jgi:hypothetical protein
MMRWVRIYPISRYWSTWAANSGSSGYPCLGKRDVRRWLDWFPAAKNCFYSCEIISVAKTRPETPNRLGYPELAAQKEADGCVLRFHRCDFHL